MAVRYISRFLVQTAPAGIKPDTDPVPAAALPARVVAGIPNALRTIPVRTGFHIMPDHPTEDDCRRQVLEILRPMQDSTTKWSVGLAASAHIEVAGLWVRYGNGYLFNIGSTVDGEFKPYVVEAEGIGASVQQTFYISFQEE
jgi:hypothetical protein